MSSLASEELREDQVGGSISLHGFSSGNICLAIAEGVARELVERPRMGYLPAVPSHVLGLLNLRGEIIPAYCLDTYLGVSNGSSVGADFISVGRGDGQAVLRISRKPKPLNKYSKIERDLTLVPDRLRLHVTSAVLSENKIWHIVEFSSLFKTMAGE